MQPCSLSGLLPLSFAPPVTHAAITGSQTYRPPDMLPSGSRCSHADGVPLKRKGPPVTDAAMLRVRAGRTTAAGTALRRRNSKEPSGSQRTPPAQTIPAPGGLPPRSSGRKIEGADEGPRNHPEQNRKTAFHRPPQRTPHAAPSGPREAKGSGKAERQPERRRTRNEGNKQVLQRNHSPAFHKYGKTTCRKRRLQIRRAKASVHRRFPSATWQGSREWRSQG